MFVFITFYLLTHKLIDTDSCDTWLEWTQSTPIWLPLTVSKWNYIRLTHKLRESGFLFSTLFHLCVLPLNIMSVKQTDNITFSLVGAVDVSNAMQKYMKMMWCILAWTSTKYELELTAKRNSSHFKYLMQNVKPFPLRKFCQQIYVLPTLKIKTTWLWKINPFFRISVTFFLFSLAFMYT